MAKTKTAVMSKTKKKTSPRAKVLTRAELWAKTRLVHSHLMNMLREAYEVGVALNEAYEAYEADNEEANGMLDWLDEGNFDLFIGRAFTGLANSLPEKGPRSKFNSKFDMIGNEMWKFILDDMTDGYCTAKT